MTHQRAIEAGAQGLVEREYGRHAKLEYLSPKERDRLIEDSQACLAAALAAEGLVVVPAEITEAMRWATWIDQSKHVGANDQEARILAGRRMIDNPEQKAMDESAYRAMITAAQQEQNDAGE